MADARTSPDAPAPEALLERERIWRGRAGAAGLVAALFITFSFFIKTAIISGAPGVLITDALRDAAGDKVTGPDGPGLLAANLTYLDEKMLVSSLGSLLEAAAWVAFGLLLLYLYDAAKGRRPQMPSWARTLLIVAIATSVVGVLATRLGQAISYSDFVSGTDHSSQAARDAFDASLIQVGGLISLVGLVGFTVSWIIVSLNAMRVGLLTRFLGTLGIIGAVLLMFPQILQLPIIQIFWLAATSLIVLAKSIGGQPPAWKTGMAEPWPTQQEQREARERAKLEAGGGKPAKAVAEGSPSPATSARKRKRRS